MLCLCTFCVAALINRATRVAFLFFVALRLHPVQRAACPYLRVSLYGNSGELLSATVPSSSSSSSFVQRHAGNAKRIIHASLRRRLAVNLAGAGSWPVRRRCRKCWYARLYYRFSATSAAFFSGFLSSRPEVFGHFSSLAARRAAISCSTA